MLDLLLSLFSGSSKPAKYVRLADTTSMTSVITFMKDYWKLSEPHQPHLALSVIGGAKNLRLDSKSKEKFISGLLKVR